MKCKTMLKFLLCFLLISVLCGPYLTYAAGPSDSKFFSQKVDVYSFDQNKTITGDSVTALVDEKLEPVYHIQSLIMYIGVVAAVIVVIIYGMQWMMATPSKRQELKSGLIPLILGVMLLTFGPRLTIMIVEFLL